MGGAPADSGTLYRLTNEVFPADLVMLDARQISTAMFRTSG
jgi:hypothetical protein